MTILRYVFGTVVALALLTLFFYVPWRIIVTNIVHNPSTLKTLKIIGIALFALFIPAMYFGHGRHIDPARLYGDSFLGIMWVTFSWSLIVGALGFIASKISGKDLSFATGFTALITVCTMLGLGFYGGLKQPEINHETVKLAKLNPAMNGLKVAIVSDTHFGPIPQEQWMKTLVERLNAQNPDVVLFVGDIADGTAEQRKAEASQLANVKAKYRGYVTGNHEYFEGAVEWENYMTSIHWNVLHNKNMSVEHNGAKLTVAGIDDRTAAQYHIPGQGADIKAALAGVDRENPIILMAHQPKQVSDAVNEKVDLQVSGHTHGGQIWPFKYLVPLDQPLVEGLKNFDGTQLFVTRGAGTWGPPLRLFAPSEINVLTLVKQ